MWRNTCPCRMSSTRWSTRTSWHWRELTSTMASNAWHGNCTRWKPHTSPSIYCSLRMIATRWATFFYSLKAFDVLERLDPNPEYWEGKRGACVGAFQKIVAGKEPRDSLREITQMLRNTQNPQVEYIMRTFKKWAKDNGIKLNCADPRKASSAFHQTHIPIEPFYRIDPAIMRRPSQELTLVVLMMRNQFCTSMQSFKERFFHSWCFS
eukprot:27692_3